MPFLLVFLTRIWHVRISFHIMYVLACPQAFEMHVFFSKISNSSHLKCLKWPYGILEILMSLYFVGILSALSREGFGICSQGDNFLRIWNSPCINYSNSSKETCQSSFYYSSFKIYLNKISHLQINPNDRKLLLFIL